MAKDMVYYGLMDAMEGDCCPICKLIRGRIDQMMDGFLYESVNDPRLRKKIDRSRGFCNEHARMLMGKGDPLAHALIYRELLALASEDAKKGQFDRYEDRSGCLFCRQAQKTEEIYAKAFAEGFREREFREKYAAGGMLCMNHLAAIHAADAAVYHKIRQATEKKYTALMELLDEIRHKNDYRFAEEAWSDGARDSWRRAVAVINDTSGIRK